MSELPTELDRKRWKLLLLMAAGVFVASIAVGLLGAFVILKASGPSARIPVVVLFLPGIVTAILTGLPVRILKKR